MEVSTHWFVKHPGIYLWDHQHLMTFILGVNQMGNIFFSILVGNSTLFREIFHIMCTYAFLVFQAHSSGHILMGVILPRILFKCRLPIPRSDRRCHCTGHHFCLLPANGNLCPSNLRPPAQSAHVPLTAVAISAVPSSAHITPAGAHPIPFALPGLAKGCAQSSRTSF